ncbi:hypothetical protein Bca4012_039909 [Brassica carinata]
MGYFTDKEIVRKILSLSLLPMAVEYRKRVNLMLIIGDISRHSHLSTCQSWKRIPLLQHLWDTLSTGGQALRRRLKFAAADDNDDDHTSLAKVDYTSIGMPRSHSYEFSDYYFDMGETIVFWDLSGCPVPEGLHVHNAVSNIEYSLRATGCRNLMSRSFFAYCDVSKIHEVLGNIYFPYPMRHAGIKEERRKKIFVDFMGKAIGHPTEENRRKKIFVDFMCMAVGHLDSLNLLLIMEDISGRQEFLHAFRYQRGYLVQSKQYGFAKQYQRGYLVQSGCTPEKIPAVRHFSEKEDKVSIHVAFSTSRGLDLT